MKHLIFVIQIVLFVFLSVGCATHRNGKYLIPNYSESRAKLLVSILRDDSETLKQMLDQGFSLDKYYSAVGETDSVSSGKETLLLYALENGATRCVLLLLDRNADVTKVDF